MRWLSYTDRTIRPADKLSAKQSGVHLWKATEAKFNTREEISDRPT